MDDITQTPQYKQFQAYLRKHMRESVPSAHAIATELGMKNAIPKIVVWLRNEGFEHNRGRWIKKREVQ
jgi:hypothetical protein